MIVASGAFRVKFCIYQTVGENNCEVARMVSRRSSRVSFGKK